MRSSLIVLLALVIAVLATPSSGRGDSGQHDSKHGQEDHHNDGKCLTDQEAEAIMHDWISFFVKFDRPLAERRIADEFVLYSESTNQITPNYTLPVNTPNRLLKYSQLSNGPIPVSTPQYASKAAFLAGQASIADGTASFDAIAHDHGCNSFTFRWTGHFAPQPVAGIDFVLLEPGSHRIRAAYSEFNSLGFVLAVGCTVNCAF
ncbi:hypothetical protein B0A49_08950 [Cryomyces minteri]|uniref:NTF2-like domain-containing protein n=1 Tax=Cryomyces minteri TaxID=331657 RepID=A0A4U0VQB8_9PEZI|nr:hypothetical protein B0A49_12237 [Cryomyces minteri]TKA61689.1 hypothetical protein B0A49_09724 [Cryomyces minteri]TKA64696.1 hypothetical protein B0A49_09192 [Cryomyces minteri]TKA65029.1 hypothetical protein B0A49_08950 [Cryomyces minteri]